MFEDLIALFAQRPTIKFTLERDLLRVLPHTSDEYEAVIRQARTGEYTIWLDSWHEDLRSIRRLVIAFSSAYPIAVGSKYLKKRAFDSDGCSNIAMARNGSKIPARCCCFILFGEKQLFNI